MFILTDWKGIGYHDHSKEKRNLKHNHEYNKTYSLIKSRGHGMYNHRMKDKNKIVIIICTLSNIIHTIYYIYLYLQTG